MGKLIITLGPDSQLRTRSRNIPDGDFVARIIPAFKYQYGQIPDDETNGFRDRTNAELLDCFFDQLQKNMMDVIRRYENDMITIQYEANKGAALANVADLPIT